MRNIGSRPRESGSRLIHPEQGGRCLVGGDIRRTELDETRAAEDLRVVVEGDVISDEAGCE